MPRGVYKRTKHHKKLLMQARNVRRFKNLAKRPPNKPATLKQVIDLTAGEIRKARKIGEGDLTDGILKALWVCPDGMRRVTIERL